MTPDAANTSRRDRPRALLGPPVHFRDRSVTAVPQRDEGRPDLPIIGPDDSPQKIARRLV